MLWVRIPAPYYEFIKKSKEMSNFSAKLNLMKLKKTSIMQIQGREQTLRCLVIPVEENHLFISTDNANNPKSAYLDINCYELRAPKYEETHMIKQSLGKEVRQNMSEEELRAIPIIGGMKPIDYEQRNAAANCNATFAQPLTDNLEVLPF